MLSSAQDCQAPELMLVGQAVALEALEALEALALLLSSTLGLISLALALVLSSAQHCQALELMLVGHAVALEALGALALMLKSTLGLIRPFGNQSDWHQPSQARPRQVRQMLQ